VDDPDGPGDDARARAEPVDEHVRLVLPADRARPPVCGAPRRAAVAGRCARRGVGAGRLIAAGVLADRRDRPRLEHVYLAVVDRPLDVLRGAVVVLDPLAERDEVADLGVGEDPLGPAVLRDVELDRLAGLRVLHHLHLLVRDGDLVDLGPPAVVHVVVRGDGARDDRLAEPPRGLDGDLRRASRRVTGEHHAGLLGVDHPLDDDRDVDVLVREPPLLAVVDRPLGEKRGPALLDAPQEVVLAHVEERLLLAGERGVWQVLGGRGRADRDERLLAVLAHRPVLREDLLADRVGERRLQNELRRALFRLAERRGVLGVDVDRLEQLGVDPGLLDEGTVRARGDGEPRRDGESRTDEFAERRGLSADGPDVVGVDVLQQEYCHSCTRRIREATYEGSGGRTTE